MTKNGVPQAERDRAMAVMQAAFDWLPPAIGGMHPGDVIPGMLEALPKRTQQLPATLNMFEPIVECCVTEAMLSAMSSYRTSTDPSIHRTIIELWYRKLYAQPVWCAALATLQQE